MKNVFKIVLFFLSFNSFGQVVTIPVVVHVLFNDSTSSPNDNIPDQQIFDQIASLNADYRRQNADTVYTQTFYRPIAADCEIEFALATIDPWGNSTNGITRTYTDSSQFFMELNNMKFDSTGGKSAWDACRYLNIWICKIVMFPNLGYVILGFSTLPGSDYEIDGVVIRPNVFGHNQNIHGRTATFEIGNYLGLRHIDSINCIDNDSIADTPIQSTVLFGIQCPSIDTIVYTCNNDTIPNMLTNFMNSNSDNCRNMFTQGQKDKMHEILNATRRGLWEPWTCGSGIKDISGPSIYIFPNPATNQITLQFPAEEKYKTAQLTILNITGQQVNQLSIINYQLSIDVSTFSKGLYLFQVTVEDQTIVRKVVVE